MLRDINVKLSSLRRQLIFIDRYQDLLDYDQAANATNSARGHNPVEWGVSALNTRKTLSAPWG